MTKENKRFLVHTVITLSTHVFHGELDCVTFSTKAEAGRAYRDAISRAQERYPNTVPAYGMATYPGGEGSRCCALLRPADTSSGWAVVVKIMERSQWLRLEDCTQYEPASFGAEAPEGASIAGRIGPGGEA